MTKTIGAPPITGSICAPLYIRNYFMRFIRHKAVVELYLNFRAQIAR